MNPKIVVIGAGLAGIAAASKLFECGFNNLTILEAENRIGGRVHTIPFASNVVDMGAQWCHGEVDNVVCELAQKHNLFDSATTKYNEFECHRSDGVLIDKNKTDRLGQLCISIVEVYKDELKTYPGSFGQFILSKYFTITSSDELYKDIEPDLIQQFIDFFHKYENSIECSDTWFETSCKGYLDYHDCDGDRLLNWKDRGSKTLLDLLMKKYPDPSKTIPIENKILFNKSVSKIKYANGVNNANEVQCSDGTTITADHIIVTVSLGVLKEKHLQLFDPPLPTPKQNAIHGFTIGTVNKIYLEFNEPFWNKDWLGFGALWTVQDLEALKNTKDEWLTQVFGFFVVDYQPRILCGWIGGVQARHMETLSQSEIERGVMWLVRKFNKGTFIPDPLNVKTTSWFSNPNFRGSYTFHSVSGDMLKAKATDLSEPCTNSTGVPVLQFAGEATHEHYFSTMHGAVESGWREAKRLADFYESKRRQSQYYDVIILGAGCAGLGAALHFKTTNSDLNVLVLEGQEKIGGRVESIAMKNYDGFVDSHPDVVENGAQWLHGTRNHLYEIAKKYDLIDEKRSEEGLGIFVRDDGFIFDEFFVKKIDFKIGQFLEECDEFTDFENGQPYPESVGVHLQQRFQHFVETLESEDERELAWQLFDWHVRFQVIDNSCLSINELSAKYWGDYCFNSDSSQSHINFKHPGFSELMHKIAMEIGSDRILVNKEVKVVDWRNGACVVKCAEGEEFTANHVIISFSIGVLKNSRILSEKFNMPQTISSAIEDVGFNTINKIYLMFETAWWGENEGFQLLWKEKSYEMEGWQRHLTGFDVLSPGPANTLLGWIGGTGAIEMEKLSDKEIIEGSIQILERFLQRKIPKPIKYACSRWHSNPFSKGSYSHTTTKCDRNGTNVSMLSEPITRSDIDGNCSLQTKHKPVVLFAGEACHKEYFSTTHGAFENGIAQAQLILNYNKQFPLKIISHL